MEINEKKLTSYSRLTVFNIKKAVLSTKNTTLINTTLSNVVNI